MTQQQCRTKERAMRQLALTLAALAVLSVTTGAASAGGTSYPVATELAAQAVAHHGGDGQYVHRPAYRHPYWRPPVIVERPVYVYPRPVYPRVVYPPIYPYGVGYWPYGGFQYYGNGFGISVGF
jgi:hypothetical protein